MVLFSAVWCKYCIVVKDFLTANPQITNVTICDVDESPELPTELGVAQLPALQKADGTLMVESADIIQHIKDNQ